MGKRLFDFVFSLISLVILSPLLILLAILIKGESSGPVFYRGVRSGLGGKPFRIFKFRTMVANAEKAGGPSTALNDPRLTRIGKILREYKLDELPQMLNILRGDMSFVGPRPQVEKYTDLYSEEERAILSVKPGITDYASIEFINMDAVLGDDNVDEKYLREIEPLKNKLRIRYVKERSFCLDCKLILMTLGRLLRIRKKVGI